MKTLKSLIVALVVAVGLMSADANAQVRVRTVVDRPVYHRTVVVNRPIQRRVVVVRRPVRRHEVVVTRRVVRHGYHRPYYRHYRRY
ncbi:hypothetical protein [Mucilaginibacter koreensis]